MSLRICAFLFLGIASVAASAGAESSERAEVLAPLSQRFAPGLESTETPDFQRHITPLLGRLGCNGRACHGSFQGRGGFQLSLFGYDFSADHEALLEEETGRVDLDDVEESLILVKPTDADMHEGGKRYDADGWEYRVLASWIRKGAAGPDREPQKLVQLQVTPAEIHFAEDDQQVQLKAVAVWEDGVREDVTELCRFSTNDEAIAEIDAQGRVSSKGKGDTHVVAYYDNAVIPVPVIRPVSEFVGSRYPEVATPTRIDELVVEKLTKLGIIPSEVCTDADFIRRVSLDLTGTLPTADAVAAFLADDRRDKRSRLVDDLLESPAYASWWATRLSDWTGNNSEQLNNLVISTGRGNNSRETAARHWYGWLRRRVEENQPYDQIVAGFVEASSREPGESYEEYCERMSEICRDSGLEAYAERSGVPYYWGRQNFNAPEDRAIGFAYNFLGLRIQCAQCHKHPFDQWSKDDFDQFARLFNGPSFRQNSVSRESREARDEMLAELDLDGNLRGNELRRKLGEVLADGGTVPFGEMVFVNRNNRNRRNRDREPSVPTGRLLGGETVELDEDPRPALMQWLRSPENPYFAPAFVNRVWANYFGRGIVNPVDDFNLANPPVNAALLAELADGFRESGFDMKWLHRTIIESDTYQRSSEANDTNRFDDKNFSRFLPRRLPAEVLVDAVKVATASDDDSAELVACEQDRSLVFVQTMNGRRNGDNYALSIFGRSTRESNCDCDRSDEPSLLQTIYLRNDSEVHAAINDRDGWVAEACKRLNVPGPRPGIDRGRLAQLQKQYDALVERRQRILSVIEAAKTDSRRPEKVRNQVIKSNRESLKRIKQRITQLERQGIAGTSGDEAMTAQLGTADLDQIIQDAYLRTLSRYPEASEQERAAQFVGDSETVAGGLAGLLWALVNTKEFSLNH